MDCDHRCDLSESSVAATLRTFTYHKHACPTSQASISCVINPANRDCLFTSGHLGLIVAPLKHHWFDGGVFSSWPPVGYALKRLVGGLPSKKL
jgi:hypothetical protein